MGDVSAMLSDRSRGSFMEGLPPTASAPSERRTALTATASAVVGCGLYLMAHFYRWSGTLPPPIIGAAWASPLLVIIPFLIWRGGRYALVATLVASILLLLVVVPAVIFELFIREDYVCIPELCAGGPGPGWYMALAGTLLATLAGFARWRASARSDAPPQTPPA